MRDGNMAKVIAKSYNSPSLVLLAMDWPDGETIHDFLGFAIKRTPGFQNNETGKFNESSWLLNRLSFNGPPPEDIQIFHPTRHPFRNFFGGMLG